MRESVHRLKTLDIYWDAVKSGEKTFEVRVNDRAFQKGDTLELVRVSASNFVDDSAVIRKRITYLLQGGQLGIERTYCVLGLGDVEPPPAPQKE